MSKNLFLFNANEHDPNDAFNQVKHSESQSAANPTVSDRQKTVESERQDPNVRVKTPNPAMAQSSSETDKEKLRLMERELLAMQQSLMDMQQTSNQQGILTEEELFQIIVPLQQEINNLLSSMKGTEEFREGEPDGLTEEESDTSQQMPDRIKNDPYRSRKKPEPGPKRQVGTADRELNYPATDFTENKSVESGDLQKAPILGFGGSGRGFRGDPERHAEAARERWAQEGVPVGGRPKASQRKPSAEEKLTIPGAIKEHADIAARRAGRHLARSAGDLLATIGKDAFAIASTLILYRILSGQSGKVTDLLKLGSKGIAQLVMETGASKRLGPYVNARKFGPMLMAWARKTVNPQLEI